MQELAENWTTCIQDREKWKKEVDEKAKTFSNERKFSAWKKKNDKGKGKVHLRTGHEGPEGE